MKGYYHYSLQLQSKTPFSPTKSSIKPTNHEGAWRATNPAMSFKVCPVISVSPADQVFFTTYAGPARWKEYLPPCFWVNDPSGQLALVVGIPAIRALFEKFNAPPANQSQIRLQPGQVIPGLIPGAAMAGAVILIVMNIGMGILSVRSNNKGHMTEQYA